MNTSVPKRTELLAGFVGSFQSDFVAKAVQDGDLDRAIRFSREIVRHDPITSAQINEHDAAIELLEQFDYPGGFDEYIGEVTDNPDRILVLDLDPRIWSDEAILSACSA